MSTLLTEPFTIQEITPLRHDVARHASASGLAGARLEDFVLAVHEGIVNAVEHGGGHGHLKMWSADGLLRVEIVDHGPGIPPGYLNGHGQPSDTAFTGRGIYLIRRFCDGVDLRTGPAGTTVQITMRLPRHAPRHASPMKRVRVAANGNHRHAGHFTA
ncbi:ATP-binding protein [Nonomuraea sp. ZG12]|jgi:anti-sigma regulatory factor (Ser/Thr protein kinase)|uniref:ATP-binding protein n=1 Tax=Nonomuraea sp. ZG12 TaxID=3452207 RepID=UPI003F89D7AA